MKFKIKDEYKDLDITIKGKIYKLGKLTQRQYYMVYKTGWYLHLFEE